MSDYTPTTGAVRIAHWRGTAFRSADHVREDAAFDRWLAEVKAQAWEVGFRDRCGLKPCEEKPINPYRQVEN